MKKAFHVLAVIILLTGFLFSGTVFAQDTQGDDTGPDKLVPQEFGKNFDFPNLKDYQRNLYRMSQLRAGNTAEAESLALTGADRVLVLLVEFAGTDTFTWTAGTSTWDPLAKADPEEDTGTIGDCSGIAATTGDYTYSGPLHNAIPRPVTASDRSGQSIWTEDFSKKWFEDFMFGSGVQMSYNREDGSAVSESFMGMSVRDFYNDLSGGQYDITGDVLGWLPLPHSSMFYAADMCPGARSTTASGVPHGGAIPEAGNYRMLVQHALDAVNAKKAAGELPNFKWTDYDLDADGVIDRLWIVHAGYGEEDSTTLLNRTTYGEGSVWSHSSAVSPLYKVDTANNISAGPYIIMPENGGVGVFAHEYGHNLGAADLYAYDLGETSAGFWTTMADDWTGYPIGYQPPAMDPMHLDWWGWLNPTVINDPTQVYNLTIGQASDFPGAQGMVRAARIDLPKGQAPQTVAPWAGTYYWWGGKGDVMNSRMTLNTPIAVPAAPATTSLTFDLVYDIETQWDFFWVQASENNGDSWVTLTNDNTTCNHVAEWIGGLNGFPDDTCGAVPPIEGFTGTNTGWPNPVAQTFDLSAFAGKNILLRFWYMTDWGTTYSGPYLDNIAVTSGATTLLSDNAETANSNWTFTPLFERSNGIRLFDHSFYVQWRNTHENGGYDSALGDTRWRYGEANTGMLVWYNNTMYTDNEVAHYLTDFPSYGPKGMMLVVDSHPEPYRYPDLVTDYPNEGANTDHRGMMRDATFTLQDTVDFTFASGGVDTFFEGLLSNSTFHDALGYYPGLEFTHRSPFQSDRWITKQWDASAVVPAEIDYALKAPGYVGTGTTAAQEVRYGCSINPAGLLGCYYYGAGVGLGYNGGNGNPADVDGQYGWHIELVDEATDHTWGKVRIWNSQYAVDSLVLPASPTVIMGQTATMTAAFKNTGSTSSYLACASIDTAHLEYVPGSATGDPIELASCPVGANQAVSAESTGVVGGLAWVINNLTPGSTSTFTYQVIARQVGTAEGEATVINLALNEGIHTSQTIKPLDVVWYTTRFPMLAR